MYAELLFLVALSLLYRLISKRLTYWERHGVPQHPIRKILKDDFDALTQKQTQLNFLQTMHKPFPNHRYFGVYQLSKKYLVVQDPELIKEITTKNFDHFTDHVMFGKNFEPLWYRNIFALEGKEWKEMRATLNPTFTGSKMKMIFDLLLPCCEQFLNYVQKQLDNQTCYEVDLKDAFARFGTDVIAAVIFGYGCDSLSNPDNDFYVNSKHVIPNYSFLPMLRQLLIFNIPLAAKLMGTRHFSKKGSNFFLNMVKKNIRDREMSGIVRHDLIHLLMEARKNYNTVDITAQAIIFYFAEVDTMPILLCLTAYELATHPHLQKRLQKEIDDTLVKHQGNITYSALHEMKYLEMIISETLRKWPAVIVDRVCTKPYVIKPENDNEKEVYLNKGDVVWIAMHGVHMNPTFFPNPEKFDPERFNDDNKANMYRDTNIPFGSGPRGCIAKRFALMQMKMMTFKILSKFDIVAVDKTRNPNEEATVLSALAVGINEMWVGLKLRNCKEKK